MMLPGRWEDVDRIYQEALERPAEERAAYVAAACAGDEALRREIISLLAQDQSSFLESEHRQDIADILLPDRSVDVVLPLPTAGSEPSRAASLPRWAQAAVALAAVRTAIGLIVYLGTSHPDWPQDALPYPVYAALAASFTVVGLALVLANRRDLRAAWLGGVYVLLVAPMAAPLLRDALWLLVIRPETLSAAFLWRFIRLFPSPLASRWDRVARGIGSAAAMVGAAFFVAILVRIIGGPSPDLPGARGWFTAVAVFADRWYWLIAMVMSLPGLAVLAWRAIAATAEQRRRVRIFAGGLLLGVAPISIELLLEELSPGYSSFIHSPGVEPIVGTIVFGSMALVPFVTAYSVLYDQVVEMRMVLRAAVRYALARYTIVAVTLVPFAALALFLYVHRTEPMVALLSGPRPLLLTGFGVVGLLALRLRGNWLVRLDRRYFREAYDAREILARVVGGTPPTSDTELANRLPDEISHALHATVAIFVVDGQRVALRHVEPAETRLPPLAVSSTLAELVLADARPMDVNLDDPASPLARLPREELAWLRRGGFSLLVGLRRAGGGPAGLLALTSKQSGLPYSPEDRRLLATVAATAGLALDSLRLASTPDSASVPAAGECLNCSRLSPPGSERCLCGGDLVEAAVPHTLRGIFRLEERIGAGGMGVVYRATDLDLHRDVAIKALPELTPAGAARLRREAQAMAAVTHPNLAVIHGIETWRDRPFLVQEYLAGGTLAQRLSNGLPAVSDTLTIGITLADLLQHLHRHGVIHCDIKPSNIGFTRHDVVKLLDFGLARVFRDVQVSTAQSTRALSRSAAGRPLGGWFGTPQFMSPEAIRGEPPTPHVDVWALCVVLFQALTGRPPFTGPDAAAVFSCILSGSPPDAGQARPDLAPAFTAFFNSAFAPDPASRPSGAGAVASSLRDLRLQNA